MVSAAKHSYYMAGRLLKLIMHVATDTLAGNYVILSIDVTISTKKM